MYSQIATTSGYIPTYDVVICFHLFIFSFTNICQNRYKSFESSLHFPHKVTIKYDITCLNAKYLSITSFDFLTVLTSLSILNISPPDQSHPINHQQTNYNDYIIIYMSHFPSFPHFESCDSMKYCPFYPPICVFWSFH